MRKKLFKKIKIFFNASLVILILSLFISNVVLAQNCAQGFQPNGQGECVPIIPIDDDNSNPGTPTEQSDPVNNDNPNEVTVGPNSDTEYKEGYQLLAPLDGLASFNTAQPCAFSEYLNILIKLFIGICAVLAVIIIVVGGIEYMTSELVSSKEHGKGQMTQAVFGLILALGAWLILNQLNPNLLELCLDNLQQATPLQDDREVYSNEVEPEGAVPTNAKVTGCAGTIVSVTTSGGKITGCSTIMNSVQAMINKAWAQNPPIKISGSGFRTKQRQVELRIANCGCSAGDEYCINKKPSSQCSPPTAVPGASRHERGLAFDLRCDGVKIATRDNECFVWLKNNAAFFKLQNFPKEPWHWSVDGR